jgi:hypothetical protein
VSILGAGSDETQFVKGLVQGPLHDRALQNEVGVLRDIDTGMDSDAGASGQHGPDATAGEMGADRGRHLLEGRGLEQLYEGLPARLGRRRSWAVSARRWVSASASRRTNASSSVRAKYRGLML